MPKSFLVKNKKCFYNSSATRMANCSSPRGNGLFLAVPPCRLIQSSQSAFQSFSSNGARKTGNKVKYVFNGDFSDILSSSSYTEVLPINRYPKAPKTCLEGYTENIVDSSDVSSNEHSRTRCKDSLKENIEEEENEQTVHFPTVKGPLPQSTFICQLCKQVYTDAFSLAQHKCSGIKHVEHRCPECSKVFSCPANLASHRRWHRPRSPTSNKPLKVTKNKSQKATQRKGSPRGSLSGGMEAENNLEICEQEDQEDLTLNNLQDENNNATGQDVEENSGNYSCDQCGKSFRRQAYLRKHINYHGNSRPYPCQYCGKVFRSLTNRAKHVLNHAVGPKGHICDVCENRFPNRTSLDKHSRIHAGEIFSCTQCGSTFYSSPGLQRHLTRAHSQSEDSQGAMLISAR